MALLTGKGREGEGAAENDRKGRDVNPTLCERTVRERETYN